jgi:hypothetical protein
MSTARPFVLVVTALCALPACASMSDEQPPPPDQLPPVSAEQQQSFAEYLESQSPGAHHQQLEPLIGRFDAQVLHFMGPDQPPMESSGTMENSWTLGGRFVLSQYRGEAMGLPFEGLGLLGYDTLKQKYVGNWADSMATSLWPTATGDSNDDGNAITLSRVMTDQMSGELVKVRDVTTIVDHDHFTYEMFITRPGTEEAKALEIHYTRT